MKHLDSLSIKNFRGFYEKQIITFSKPNNKIGSGLTIIVGPNNSGKTTVLEAIKKFYVGNTPQFGIEDRHKNAKVEIIMANADREKKKLTTEGGSVATEVNKGLFPNSSDISIISSRRYWEAYFGTNQINHEQHKNVLLNIDRSGKDSSFGSVMIGIESDLELKQKFNLRMKKLIPHFSDWHMELSRNQNYISYKTGKGDMHNSDLFGDGIISMFKLVATIVCAAESEIIIIDEPELSLHPQAQKRLLELLAEESKKRQIIITTHSPYFIRWDDITNGALVYRMNKINDKKCEVSRLTESTILSINRLNLDFQKPHLLDVAAREIFFSEKVLFLEGQEDVALIRKFLKETTDSINFDIFGYGAGCAGNIHKFLKMAADLKIKSAALFDRGQTQEINKCKRDFPESLIAELPKDDIRDKIDESGAVIKEGVFDNRGNIKLEYEINFKEIIEGFISYFK